MTIFKHTLSIPYYDTDPHYYLRPNAIIRYMIDTSTRQTDLLFKNDKKKEPGLWLLYNWHLDFLFYPKSYSHITIDTYATDFNRSIATRNFDCFDQNGSLFARASTTWFYIDPVKRTPMPIDELATIYGVTPSDYKVGRFKPKPISQPDMETQISVSRLDIDGNYHVNNAVYLDWMLESIELEVYQKYDLKEAYITYKKEVKLNQRLISKIKIDYKQENKVCYFHEIMDMDSQIIHTSGWTRFERRKEV